MYFFNQILKDFLGFPYKPHHTSKRVRPRFLRGGWVVWAWDVPKCSIVPENWWARSLHVFKDNTFPGYPYLRYFSIFGLHNDPFEDCKQWKLLKHIQLSDLNPAIERVGWERGSELFAYTVFDFSIYFCLTLCFLQSRSRKLFKTPNILKIRFEN